VDALGPLRSAPGAVEILLIRNRPPRNGPRSRESVVRALAAEAPIAGPFRERQQPAALCAATAVSKVAVIFNRAKSRLRQDLSADQCFLEMPVGVTARFVALTTVLRLGPCRKADEASSAGDASRCRCQVAKRPKASRGGCRTHQRPLGLLQVPASALASHQYDPTVPAAVDHDEVISRCGNGWPRHQAPARAWVKSTPKYPVASLRR